jgi:DnaJ family protein B protein 12
MPRPRQAGAQQQGGGGGNQSSPTMWLQLLPLIFLFLFSLLTQLPSLLSPRAVPDPTFSFSPTNVYSLRMMTHASDIPYWVNPRQFSSHSLYESFLDANPTKRSPSASSAGANIDKTSPTYRESLLQSILQTIPDPESQEAVQERKKERVPTNFRNFERKVETAWQRYLQEICQADLRNREDRLMQAKGCEHAPVCPLCPAVDF